MSEPERREDAAVRLALRLSARPAGDECPELEEICAWADGTLREPRRGQVKSHIAHCECCFAVWTELLDAGGLPQESVGADVQPARTSASWLSGWRALLGGRGLAAGVAAVLAVVVLAPLLQDDPLRADLDAGYAAFGSAFRSQEVPQRWPWSDGFATRSAVPAEGDASARIAAEAFRAGVGAGLADLAGDSVFWSRVATSAPALGDVCEARDAIAECEDVAQAMASLGRWAALLHLACEADGHRLSTGDGAQLDPSFWARQATLLERMDTSVSTAAPGSSFARLLQQWTAQIEGADDARGALCARAPTLMTLGLQG